MIPIIIRLFRICAVIFLASTPSAYGANDFEQACRTEAAAWQETLNAEFQARETPSTDDRFLFRSAGNTLDSVSDLNRLAKPVMLLYSLDGEECFRSHRRIQEGDLVYFGVIGDNTKIKDLRGRAVSCGLQSPDIAIFDALADEEIATLSTSTTPIKYGLYRFPPIDCYGVPFTYEVSNQNNQLFSTDLTQYPRYRGTFQLGTVITSLGDREFGTTEIDSDEIIFSKSSRSKGPLYVGSLVLYGLPHYFSAFQGGGNYAGRDIVNENNWKDALGLALSIGLSDPENTFGVGLSFEIARGFNVTASRLYRRVDRLGAGLATGDTFNSSATTPLPLEKDWDDEWVFGLSLDSRYISKFFSQ